jgi:hypothetical protein
MQFGDAYTSNLVYTGLYWDTVGTTTRLGRLGGLEVRHYRVNGWGTLQTPFGNFQVLRQSGVTEQFDTSYTEQQPGVWLPRSVSRFRTESVAFFADANGQFQVASFEIQNGRISSANFIPYPVTTLSDSKDPKEQVGLYPNPSTTEFYVPAMNGHNNRVQLWNTAGQVVLEQGLEEGVATRVSTAGLPQGIYQFVVMGGSVSSRGRLVVE